MQNHIPFFMLLRTLRFAFVLILIAASFVVGDFLKTIFFLNLFLISQPLYYSIHQMSSLNNFQFSIFKP